MAVNAIAPGCIATDHTAARQADEARTQAILDRLRRGSEGVMNKLRCVGELLLRPSPPGREPPGDAGLFRRADLAGGLDVRR